MQRSTVTKEGAISIPQEIRNKFGLNAGAEVMFEQTEKGILIVPIKDSSDELIYEAEQPENFDLNKDTFNAAEPIEENKHYPFGITCETIKKIAEELDSGMLCFYHKTTGQLVTYPEGFEDFGLDDIWGEEVNKVEEHPDDYIGFEKMGSRESFRMMEAFVDEVITDGRIQQKFYEVLQRRKPFFQFKEALLGYDDLREKWFAYKAQKLIAFVEEQIRDLELDEE